MSKRRDRRLKKEKKRRDQRAQRQSGPVFAPTAKLWEVFDRHRPPEAEGRHLTAEEVDRMARAMADEIVPEDAPPDKER